MGVAFSKILAGIPRSVKERWRYLILRVLLDNLLTHKCRPLEGFIPVSHLTYSMKGSLISLAARCTDLIVLLPAKTEIVRACLSTR